MKYDRSTGKLLHLCLLTFDRARTMTKILAVQLAPFYCRILWLAPQSDGTTLFRAFFPHNVRYHFAICVSLDSSRRCVSWCDVFTMSTGDGYYSIGCHREIACSWMGGRRAAGHLFFLSSGVVSISTQWTGHRSVVTAIDRLIWLSGSIGNSEYPVTLAH